MAEVPTTEFEDAAPDSSCSNLLGEFWCFLKQNKKWWLLPILVVLLCLSLLMLLAATAGAPFIYTLF